MRVISGYLKNRQLRPANKLNIRPATDRVKETIFNVLQTRLDLEDASILDLFAGTGSLGIEAISRSASKAIFVDSSPKACKLIKENIQILGIDKYCEIICTDAIKFIEHSQLKFDLIFADPPYEYPKLKEIPIKIFSNKILKLKGYLIIEHSKKTVFEDTELYKIELQKEFGNTIVTFFQYIKKEEK